ncbi:diguanylate cyclase (GGDEF) domain-containing protein [Noviherbaspirillum humi]|uniref:Diguanylate cyclase (GGDEF) domain-containing protein n=2 Tax=Noviherbaspirillum humi TaxID=1688639 RepID=A0A239HDA4_9BURK|nr:diguanylate cyclase (GGDEF) domain-containing protein [Noviherbaspirillum humi]
MATHPPNPLDPDSGGTGHGEAPRSERLSNWTRHGVILPALVLLLCLGVTRQLWQDARDSARQELQTRFDFRVRESNRRIEQRMLTYEQVLRGVAGLFAASSQVTRQEFHRYASTLRLKENYPGIQALGFSAQVPASEIARFVDAMRAEGFPDYQAWPAGSREWYGPVQYIEPFEGRNLRAFGFDMLTDPVRRAAMEQARDTGKAAVSGKVTLVQETDRDMQIGFLMYMPIYRDGASPDSADARRDSLSGWVYAAFRMTDLMNELQGDRPVELDVEVYDGNQMSDQSRMFDTLQESRAAVFSNPLTSIQRLEIAGHSWIVVNAALPGFAASADTGKAELILRGGISIALLLALLTWLLLDDRTRALRASEQAMRLALYDVLTGLPNRKLMMERLGQSIAAARRERGRVALMFIDLDRFKPVNDNYGHAIGDLLLKEVASRLQHSMRESDTAARLGGDEFVLLLPRAESNQGVAVVAHKVLQELNRPFLIAGHEFHISASIGVAFFPDDAVDEKILIRYADDAMYQAKHSGRGTIHFYRHPGKQA